MTAPLTDEQIDDIKRSLTWWNGSHDMTDHRKYARAIESALRAQTEQAAPLTDDLLEYFESCAPSGIDMMGKEASEKADALHREMCKKLRAAIRAQTEQAAPPQAQVEPTIGGHSISTWREQAAQLIRDAGPLIRAAFNDTPGPSPTDLANWMQYASRTMGALAAPRFQPTDKPSEPT